MPDSSRVTPDPPAASLAPGGNPRRTARLWTLGLMAGLALLSLWLLTRHSRLGTQLVRASYDSLFVLGGSFKSVPANPPVVLVYLDLDSFIRERQNPVQPWDRTLHGRLVERLRAAGARAVVFDILFGEPAPDPAADIAFAQALRASGRAVLCAELNRSSRASADAEGVRSTVFLPPTPILREAAAAVGGDVLRIDEDFVVRRHFSGFLAAGEPSLAWATAQLLDLPATRSPEFLAQTRWVNYYGPPFALPHVSYSAALDPRGAPDAAFRDRVVFVGARPMTGLFRERRDEFRSPHGSWDSKELFHPGVEVHATQWLNLQRGDWLWRWPADLEAAVLVGLALLLGVLLPRFRPLPAAGVALAAEGLITASALYAFVARQFWSPWLIPAAVLIPVALAVSVLHHSLDWYRQRRRLEAIRRLAEQKVREQASLIDKAQDAILVLDLDRRLTYANPGAQRLYRASLDELEAAAYGRNALSADAALASAAFETLRARGEWQGELRQRTPDGRDLIVECRWTLIRDDRGQPQAILQIHTDATERRRLEAQVLRSQRLDTIGALAGGMAHDLNNALAPVLMGVQLLQRRAADEDTQRMLSVMQTNTHRGADLVRQILLFARGRDGDRQTVCPGPLLREMERMVRETFPRSLRIQAMVPDDLWTLHAQPTQLHQILLNLCVNARDAMPAGGELVLAADNVNLTPAEAAAIPNARPGEFVMLVVTDTGSGIPPDVLPRIFDPFYSTKGEGQGTGLGLSTVARLVDQHHGFLRVETTPGEGTSFEVYLPRAETVPIPPDPRPADELPRGRGELVLVIDDEQSIRELLTTALADHGYRALSAAGGLEAQPLLREHRHALRAIILDHQMPDWDGPHTLQAIRRIRPDLPVILTSGERDGIPDETATDGRLDHLPKPFRLEDLFGILARRLA